MDCGPQSEREVVTCQAYEREKETVADREEASPLLAHPSPACLASGMLRLALQREQKKSVCNFVPRADKYLHITVSTVFAGNLLMRFIQVGGGSKWSVHKNTTRLLKYLKSS